MTLQARLIERVADLSATEWNALEHDGSPFMRHEFLAALENTGCVGEGTGWRPWIITLHDAQGLAAAAPGWLKDDSYGEFVFDFAWAQAYARHGLAYYPKVVVAAPFTPASGPRLLVRADLAGDATGAAALRHALQGALRETAREAGLSSVHLLFPDSAARQALDGVWLERIDCQFHWTNRGYASFEDFLGSFTAEKRKKAKRERRRVAEAGIRFETRLGNEATRTEILTAWELHRITFRRRGNEPYLGPETFIEIARSMGESLLFKFALHGEEIVAVAVFFVGVDTLYGRYWGAADEYHSLHFETCYHQGIEFCIERGLTRFEPGTQGEHKVSRGFVPTLTYSAHCIFEPRFRSAIADYLQREREAIERYAAGIAEHVPYRDTLDTA
ncbi:MAG: GNAT family N-acetyltransferase [Gammaproteobacteria bacterium]|nr:GNAT family N-acetyltransferase [Gammaproteobacteria bacterium]